MQDESYTYGRWLSTPPPGDEVVITGISGQFPKSRNIKEFRDNLYNKRSMVSKVEERWDTKQFELPPTGGFLADITQFDPGFFGIHYRQSRVMEQTVRGFLEVSLEAILDAGVHPDELIGSKTGVFVGYSWSDMKWPVLKAVDAPQMFAITGYLRSIVPKRVSYFLKLKGPSLVVDTACSSSLTALDVAFKAVRSGQCDQALVGSCHLTLGKNTTLQFASFGVLTKEGNCKVFDQDADGYVRSEAISCVFLQKAKDSRRIYCRVVHTKANHDGFKNEGIFFPSSKMQSTLLKEMYCESNIDPSRLTFMELHGTGTKVGDAEEIRAVDNAICVARTEPLYIGSVKSCVGHAEPVSGLISLAKIVLSMEENILFPNINFKKIKQGITALEQGRLKVVTEVTPIKNSKVIMGVSNFGFGGTNCHVILERVTEKKTRFEDNIPRLVCVSGRTEESVKVILEQLNQKPANFEFVGLLHQVFKTEFKNHLYRGYSIVTKDGSIVTSVRPTTIQKCNFYVNFGQFENCYKTVGQYFLQFPVFQNSIHQINIILANHNLNVIDIIQKRENSINEKILGAASVQIGIVDTLKELGLDPIGIFTTSSGKQICNYVNQNLTLKELIQETLEEKFESKLAQNPEKYQQIHKQGSTDVNPIPQNSVILDLSDSNFTLLKNQNIFLIILGQLFENGHTFSLHKLYPEVVFPVGRNTPMLSPLIRWSHTKQWKTNPFENREKFNNMECYIRLADDNLYLSGHVIDGRNLFPATGYLNILWILMAKAREIHPTYLPIIFENCKFLRATIPKIEMLTFSIMVQKNSGIFEITENDNIVVTGRVCTPNKINFLNLSSGNELINDPKEVLDEYDVNKELYLRGYNYIGAFKGIVKCNIDASAALVRWENKWDAFMDKMLQMKLLEVDSRLLFVPIGIDKVSIDPVRHMQIIESLGNNKTVLKVDSYKHSNTVRCGGIEICGLQARPIARRKPLLEPVLEKNVFVPNKTSTDLVQSVRINTQIILEESPEINFKALEIHDEYSNDPLLMPLLFNVLEDVPVIHPDLTISTKNYLEEVPGIKIEQVTLAPSSDFHLIVASKLLERTTLLNQVLGALSPCGFVLTREDKNFVPENTEKIAILTQHTTENEKLVLFKKVETSNQREIVELSSSKFQWMSQLKEALKSGNKVIVYSQNHETEGILGFVNCLRREPEGKKIRCVFIMDDAPKFDPENNFYSHQINKNMAFNVYKDSQWGTYRHLRLEESTNHFSEHSFVTCLSRGDLSTLKWVDGPLSTKNQNPNLVITNYCAINFKDIMTASARITLVVDRKNQEILEGFEFSGQTISGQRVMGMVQNGGLSTMLLPDPELTWFVPDDWSLEEAATVPVVYLTVICALLIRISLKPGSSILIHSGTGGVGLAAINVALYYGCKIFVTVGTQEKRDFLKEHFPQISDSQIGNSRDTSFKERIFKETEGRGVDIVLNSLAEEKLVASIQCLAQDGNFMEIGKFDMINNNKLELLLLQKNASYHGVMLDTIMTATSEIKQKLHNLVSEGLKSYIKPLPKKVFKNCEVEAAFRYMTTGKHIGKVLLEIKKENQIETEESLIQSLPRFWANPEKCYIIIGGLGGFGLELADWLVLRGARKLLLTSRTGIQTGYQTQRIKIWESYGVTVHISTTTISSKQNCINLIREATTIGPLDGIFNLAVVLKDELFENQTVENFETSLTPKAFATKYLDKVTRELCPDLSYFVVFSSVSCGRGNVGQTNYGMANSIMERICEKRKAEGFPALAIQWGAIGDVGLVAKMQKDNKELVIGGTLQQNISSCLSVLDRFLKQESVIVSSMIVAEKRKKIGSGNAVDVVATILGIKDMKVVNPKSTLTELGMDSILGNEILQTLEKDFEIYLPPKDLRTLTIEKLIELENDRSKKTQEDKIEQGTNALVQLIPESTSDDYPYIKLESLTKDTDEAPTVFVLPGVEGVVRLVEPLTKKLKAHVLGLQYSYKNPEDTVQEMATKLLPTVKQILKSKNDFILIAYSFGVSVAIELVILLEQENYFGKIFAIDGAPRYLKSVLSQYLTENTETEEETLVIITILTHFLPVKVVDNNKERLYKCQNFNERIDVCLSLIPAEILEKKNLDPQAAITLMKRFRAIRNYQESGKIKSVIKLYKPKIPLVKNMANDYNLSEVFEEKIEVMDLKGNHVTIVEQDELAEDINRVLKFC